MHARRRFHRAAAAALLGVGAGRAFALAEFKLGDDPAASAIWAKVRASVFDAREVRDGTGLVTLETPMRAIDAAVVPLAVRVALPAPETLARLVVVIDANPSPVSGIFQFAGDVAAAALQTRVRVDGYSHVRAIAETASGRLFAVTRFVRAAGGCSAPPGIDAAAALASLGRMQLRRVGDDTLQLQISHPNHSGLAMDQLTRQFTPAHYVRQVEVLRADGRRVWSADVDFSISENPSFRFTVPPLAPDEALQVRIVDSQERRFEQAFRAADLRAASAGG